MQMKDDGSDSEDGKQRPPPPRVRSSYEWDERSKLAKKRKQRLEEQRKVTNQVNFDVPDQSTDGFGYRRERTAHEIRRGFKFRKKYAEKEFKQAEDGPLTDEDENMVVLVCLMPFLASVPKFQHAGGHVPCEGHFKVLDMSTEEVLLDKGFIYLPQGGKDYCEKKEWKENVAIRLVRDHGVDPTSAILNQLSSASDGSFIVAREPRHLGPLLDEIQKVVAARKSLTEGNILFICRGEMFENVKSVMSWIQSKFKYFGDHSIIKEIEKEYEAIDVKTPRCGMPDPANPSSTTPLTDPTERCKAHPLTYLARNGRPFYCCRTDVERMHKAFVKLNQDERGMDINPSSTSSSGSDSESGRQRPVKIKRLDPAADKSTVVVQRVATTNTNSDSVVKQEGGIEEALDGFFEDAVPAQNLMPPPMDAPTVSSESRNPQQGGVKTEPVEEEEVKPQIVAHKGPILNFNNKPLPPPPAPPVPQMSPNTTQSKGGPSPLGFIADEGDFNIEDE